MNNRRRVVITGVGAVTPLGNSIEETWQAVKEGKSGVGPLTRLDVDKFAANIAAEVKDFEIEQYIERKEARKMDRFTHYALAASIMAMKDATLEVTDELYEGGRSGCGECRPARQGEDYGGRSSAQCRVCE